MGRLLCRILLVLMVLILMGNCGPRTLPAAAGSVPRQPGRYVQESFVASDFNPAEVAYTFAAFPVEQGDRAPSEAFQNIFQEELLRAWQAQGLQVKPGGNSGRLAGVIHRLSLRGTRVRWLTGRIHASLSLSGTITFGDRVVFAFWDSLRVSSPVAPGPAAPREQELLLRRLAREAVHRLLNELLLQGRNPESD